MKKIISIILGGGQGTRLFPLTKERSKPAVPIGGKYRLIDIPITNCLRSNINKIFILTQFNSESLNRHVTQTYRFDNFHNGFVNILAAEQTTDNKDWFQGTADAVRKNLMHIFENPNIKYVLILSGDQIYKMDFNLLIDYHKEQKNDLTISVIPVNSEDAKNFGIMKVEKGMISDFIEKPRDINLLNQYNCINEIKKIYNSLNDDRKYLGSMGIYLFNAETLKEVLNNSFRDFGKEVIPHAIKTQKVGAYFFNDYWEDVGTIRSFLKANIDFTKPLPKFNLYDDRLYTNARYLPPSKVVGCRIDEALLCEGSIIQNATIKSSIIGIRSIIRNNVIIEDSLIMGADYYESEIDKKENQDNNKINIGIDDNTIIKNTIVDKNSRIGKNCKITNYKNLEYYDGPNYYIRDGIIIIPKNVIIEDNTVI
jgi:glucose-1-phosphate adenylyltransferase